MYLDPSAKKAASYSAACTSWFTAFVALTCLERSNLFIFPFYFLFYSLLFFLLQSSLHFFLRFPLHSIYYWFSSVKSLLKSFLHIAWGTSVAIPALQYFKKFFAGLNQSEHYRMRGSED